MFSAAYSSTQSSRICIIRHLLSLELDSFLKEWAASYGASRYNHKYGQRFNTVNDASTYIDCAIVWLDIIGSDGRTDGKMDAGWDGPKDGWTDRYKQKKKQAIDLAQAQGSASFPRRLTTVMRSMELSELCHLTIFETHLIQYDRFNEEIRNLLAFRRGFFPFLYDEKRCRKWRISSSSSDVVRVS